MKEVVEGVQQALLPPTSENGVDDLLQQVANAATQSSQVVPQLVQQMQQMQALMMQMQGQLNSSTSPPPPTGPRRERRQYYCWTHGLCYHSGDRCRTKKEGHRDTATLQNKMGGNTRGCSTST